MSADTTKVQSSLQKNLHVHQTTLNMTMLHWDVAEQGQDSWVQSTVWANVYLTILL